MCYQPFLMIGLFLVARMLITDARPRFTINNMFGVKHLNTTEEIPIVRDRRGIRFQPGSNIFPDDYDDGPVDVDLRIDSPPNCANGDTFCENFKPYPSEKIQTIMEKNLAYREFWGKDDASDVLERDGLEESFVCAAIQRTIFPNIAKNKHSKWKYIVNQPDGDFRQGIRIETCISPSGSCRVLGELPNGYVTYCKQKYIYRRLISISEHGTPITDTFQIPSACCCAYRRNFNFMQRFGGETSPARRNDKS